MSCMSQELPLVRVNLGPMLHRSYLTPGTGLTVIKLLRARSHVSKRIQLGNLSPVACSGVQH